MPDAVVIGSGPNGLVAANLLADRGWEVVVLEAQDTPGGAVRSESLIEPGFVNDVFSAFYPLGVASPAMKSLHLEDHGLRWCRAPIVLAHPALDGTCPVISCDIDETAASLDELAPGDGDAWRRLYARWQRVGGPLVDALMNPFPPVRHGARLLGRLRPSEVLPFARFALLPVRTMAEEAFTSEGARRLLVGNALHSDLFPESILSGMFGWLLAMLGQELGWPVPEGGAGRLTEALVNRLTKAGGSVQCDAAVERVVLRGGRAVAVRTAGGEEIAARRAVIADVSAPALFHQLVGDEHLPASFVDALGRFAWDSGTVKVDWTLDAPIPWRAAAARRAGTVHLVESVDALTRLSAEMATGQIPERPFMLVGQQSMTDPTRMPPGAETGWAYTHVPHGADVDAAELADQMESIVEEHAPGFKANIRGRHVMGPRDLEGRNANLVGGSINGGTAQLFQQLIFRPTPGVGRPETPIDGLYLGSSSAHPGGGVHGACGANAASAALAHAGRLGRLRPV